MKLFNIKAFTLMFFAFGLLCNNVNAQSGECRTTGGCSGGTLFPSAEKSTTTDNWTIVSTVIYAGEYAIYNVTSGQTYEWSLLSADGGSSSYDSQLTLLSFDGLTQYCYSDDVQNLNAKIQWTASFTGKVRVLVSLYNCQTNTINTTLVWRCASCGVINAPANDECAGAESLSVYSGSTCGGATTGNVLGATNSGITECVGTANNDVWYKFVATSANFHNITVVGSADFDAVINLRVGPTCSGTNIACSDNSGSGGTEVISADNLITGQTYYVRVYDYWSSLPTTTSFTICITAPSSCEPAYIYGTSSNDFVNSVELTGENSTSISKLNSGGGTPFIKDYSALSADLKPGTTYSLKLTNGTYGGQTLAAWIDYNSDGIYQATEKLGEFSNIDGGLSVTIPFTVPAGATIGTTKMLVRAVWSNTDIDPCETYSYGEAEIYGIKIITPCVTPAAPGLLSASLITDNTATISWSAGSPAGSPTITYYWAIGAASNVSYESNYLQRGSGATLSTNLTVLIGGTQYYYTVKAVTSCNGTASSYASALNFTTSCVTPATPISLSTTDISTSSARLNWVAGTPAGSPTVTYYWAVNTGSTVNYETDYLQRGITSNLNVFVYNLSLGTTYYWTVKAVTNCGSSSASAYATNVNFTTSATVVDVLTWTGNTSTDWNTISNWNPAQVPTVDNNVIIPSGCSFYPIISEITGNGLSINNTDNTYRCKSLTIENGASVTLKNSADWKYPNLSCSGILNINGKFTHSYHASPNILCLLKNGSNVTVNSTGIFNIGDMSVAADRYNSLTLEDGAKLNINGGTVSIMNSLIHKGELNMTSGALYIKRYGSGNNPAQTDGYPSWDSYLTAKLSIQDGDVYICGNQSGKRMIDWNAAKTVNWTGGTLHLTLKEHTYGTDNSTNLKFNGHSINNLTINRLGMTNTIEELTGNDLVVKGNLTITNGTLAATSKNISAAGNWTNNGTFTAGTGSVFFSGANKTIDGTKTSTFYNLSFLDGSSYTLNPTTDRAEVDHTFIIESNSSLNLSSDKRLSLRSSTNTINGNITTASTKYDEAVIGTNSNFEIYIRRDNTLSGSGTIAADLMLYKDSGVSSITTLSSDLTIDGSLWISNDGNGPAELVLGTNKITLAGNWISNGTFDSGTGTVVFNPNENRTVRTFTTINNGTIATNNNFCNLRVQAASGKTVKLLRDNGTGVEEPTTNAYSGHLLVNNNLEVISGTFSTGGSDMAGRKLVSKNVTLVETGATLNIGGNSSSEFGWGTFTSEFRGDIILRGNITTTRPLGSGYADIFLLGARLIGSGALNEFGCDVQIHNAAITTQESDVYIEGDLIIGGSGTLKCESNKVLSIGKIFYVYHNLTHKGTVNVYGDMTNGSKTTDVVNINTSIFNFIQSGSKLTKLSNKIMFGEVNIKGGGTRDFQQDIDCASDLTIDAGSTMNMNTTADSKNISLSQSANFINNGTFVPYTNTVSFTGNAAQNITGSTQTKFHNLEINKTGSGVYPQNIAEVSNQLMLTNGIFYTSTSKYISLLDQSSVNPAGGKAASFVNGPIFKTGRDGISGNYSFVFPTGKNGIWARIEATGTTGTTATTDVFMAEYFDFPYPVVAFDGTIQAVSTVEYWNLSKINGNADLQKKVKLYSEDKDRSGIISFTDNVDLTVAHFNTVTQKWEDIGLTASSETGITGWVTSGVNPDFSPFTFGSTKGENPLPVSLLGFEAELQKSVIETKWSTASEYNTDYFIVQKSKDLQGFMDVGIVKAAGFSNQLQSYILIDDAPWDNISYYRLKIVDFDNTFEYSNIVAVNAPRDDAQKLNANQSNSFELISLYPNPVIDEFYILVNAAENTSLSLFITDISGKLVSQNQVALKTGENKISLNAGNFVDGFYILTLSDGKSRESGKFVKR